MTTINGTTKISTLFAELEITKRCQLTCPSLCYAQSGPTAGHSSLTTAEWLHVIDQVATRSPGGRVQLIGGEPTQHPDFALIVGHALGLGLRVEVATNLFHVPERIWKVLERPGVTIAVSYHSAMAAEHDEITGRQGSHAATRANLAEAVRRGTTVRGQVVELLETQDASGAQQDLVALGVAKVSRDRARPVGNANTAHGRPPTAADLCGNCGDGRVAVLADGSIAPCVLGRFLVAGNIAHDDLGDVLSGSRWREIRMAVQAGTGRTCPPADGNNCDPNDSDDL